MGVRLVRLVEGMRLAELGLVVLQFGLLLGRKYGELPLLLWILRVGGISTSHRSVVGGQIVVVAELRKHVLLSALPCEVVVVRNVDHVVGIYCPERRETVTQDGEQGDQNAVDDVNDVNLATADVDPADEEQNPCETEQGDEGCVQGDQEAERYNC